MLKKLTSKLILFLPIILFLIVTNLVVDPAHLFDSKRYINEMVDIMLSGNSVAGATNFDDRALQKQYIARISTPFDTIVLGSSRCMQIAKNYYPDGSFFNNSVSDATLADDIAIIQLYRNKGLLPKNVIICTDPWLLSTYESQTRWKTLNNEYRDGISWIGIYKEQRQLIGNNVFDLEKFLELISPAYFQNSLQFLIKYKKPDDLIFPDPGLDSKNMMKRADGSISYDESVRNRNLKDVNEVVQKSISGQHDSNESFSNVDLQTQKEFEAFVLKMRQEDINVSFFLSPFHPIYYSFLISDENTKNIVDIQNYFTEFALAHSIQVIGSYDPETIPCSSIEFYDQKHPRPGCIQKIILQR